MRRGRGRCVICTANSDEFPTFEPESYLSSRSHDCLLRALRSFARAAAPSITRSVKRAHLRSMIRSREPLAHRRSTRTAKRTAIGTRSVPAYPRARVPPSVSPRRGAAARGKRGAKEEGGKEEWRKREICFVGEDYPATRVGGAAFCFLLTTFPFFAFFILCLGERDKKDDASAKFDTSNSPPRTCPPTRDRRGAPQCTRGNE